jgi:acetylornithine aminotransferase
MRVSPVLAGLQTYPFSRLTEAKRAVAARGVSVVDFGIGEPREETPAFIRRALADAIQPLSTYPLAEGLPELRDAVAGWVARRFGVTLDPATEVVPTLGSKELVFMLAQVVGGSRVVVTAPGYPVPERGALFAGKEVVRLALDPTRGWLPDLDAVDWDDVGLLWLNHPNNPTGSTAPLALYEQAAAIAREHDLVVACDEAYSELYFGEPPVSALQVADRTNVVAVNTLSKRSSMPGYRSGFVAGDRDVIAALKRHRPTVGVAPQEFVQRAAVAAWSDEEHVIAMRDGYRAKRDVLLPALQAAGLELVGGDATFFLWLTVPGGDDEGFAARLLERGVVCAPGSYFGPEGAGHVRFALVPTLADCERAAPLIAAFGTPTG